MCSIHPDSAYEERCIDCINLETDALTGKVSAIHRQIHKVNNEGAGYVCIRCMEIWPCETMKIFLNVT